MISRLASSCLLFAVISFASRAQTTAQQAMGLANEARQAEDANDPATWLVKAQEAADLRPDFPRLLLHLAAAQAANEQPEEAIATLTRLAATGYHAAVDKADEFATLRARPEFKEVAKKFASNSQPHGNGEIAFTLRDITGLIEGIAWREKTNEFYFGDVNGRAVWVRGVKEAKEGKPRRLTPESEDLLGVFGLAIDEERGTLWAATSAVSAMRGYTPDMEGQAGVAEIDLTSGEIRRVLLVPRKPNDAVHVLGDVALAPGGDVLLTDSGAPILWRLPPGGSELELWLEHPELISPQGLAVLPEHGVLIVADHVNGLARIDLASGELHRFETPADAILSGIDGIAHARDGSIIAIQNGVRPNRVLRITLDGAADAIAAARVLESSHLQMGDPTLGCIGPAGDFYFIANAGWSRFQYGDGPSAPRAVAIFKTKL